MSDVPPTPPLKSSQRLSLPPLLTSTPSVRVVDNGDDGPLTPSRPSMRKTTKPQRMVDDDDPRMIVAAVRRAAGGSVDRPILDRGRPRIGSTTSPQRQDSARSPPGTRAPADIDLDEGFSYIEDDTDVLDTRHSHVHHVGHTHPSPKEAIVESSAKPRVAQPTQSLARGGSFGTGKPRGLSFHDARHFMRSGRGVRPGSWHDVPAPAAARPEFVYAPPIRAASRSRSPSPDSARPRSQSPFDRLGRDEEEGRFTGVTFDLSPSPDQRDTGRGSSPPPKRRDSARRRHPRPIRSPLREHVVAALGELIGTTSFLFAAFGGVIVASTGAPDPATTTPSGISADAALVPRLFYKSFTFGIAYMISVWIFFRASEGLFNPAVTLAFLITGTNGLLRSLCLFVAQMLGAIAASALALGLFQTTAPIRTTLSPGVSVPRGLFIEAILTSQLVLAVLMLAREKHRTTSVAPLGIGLALVFAELVGIFWTGGSLNPVRSLGPNVVSWTWDSTHWVYWVGPLLGSLIAVLVHRVLMVLGHELGSPHQRNDMHVAARNPPVHETKDDGLSRPNELVGFNGALGALRYADSDLTGVINLWHRSSLVAADRALPAPSRRGTRL